MSFKKCVFQTAFVSCGSGFRNNAPRERERNRYTLATCSVVDPAHRHSGKLRYASWTWSQGWLCADDATYFFTTHHPRFHLQARGAFGTLLYRLYCCSRAAGQQGVVASQSCLRGVFVQQAVHSCSFHPHTQPATAAAAAAVTTAPPCHADSIYPD